MHFNINFIVGSITLTNNLLFSFIFLYVALLADMILANEILMSFTHVTIYPVTKLSNMALLIYYQNYNIIPCMDDFKRASQ